jgi:ubiquinone/menaquinone biosynthesis C-methylase UbiE
MIELAETTPNIAEEKLAGASLVTRRVYDALAPVYTLPTLLFHSKAHAVALAASSVDNGTRVLEVAIGSGEMLQRLVEANPDGQTVGVDLSPKMAARCQERAARSFPGSAVHCQAADVRHLPLPSQHFDAVVCCYLFELLPEEDISETLAELRRVLRPGGRLTLILIAQDKPLFNAMYRVCSRVAPAFWGRQRDGFVARLLPKCGFTTESDTHIRQFFYSSRIVSARKSAAAAAGMA